MYDLIAASILGRSNVRDFARASAGFMDDVVMDFATDWAFDEKSVVDISDIWFSIYLLRIV